MTQNLIYLDQAATSFPKPAAVIEAITNSLRDHSASPGRSGHGFALDASRIVFNARELMADLLGVDDSSRIVFTLNVTQSLNIILWGLLKPGDHVLTTAFEHNCVLRPLHLISKKMGVEIDYIPPGENGLIDPLQFGGKIRANTKLAVVNHASNVTGVLAPTATIKQVLSGVPLVVDAAQTAGAIDLAPVFETADILAFTGHKGLLGPTGVGGFWVREGLEIETFLAGGTGSRSEHESPPELMPDSLEPGTPNTHGLAGFAAGVDFILETGVKSIREHEMQLTKNFVNAIEKIDRIKILGPKGVDPKIAVISIVMEGWSASQLSMTLEREFGILTRPGLHCAPRTHKAIGTFPGGATRFSFGWFNTLEEIARAGEALTIISRRAS